jgi:ATP-dependent Clp protease ATP-binding subunit ClpA
MFEKFSPDAREVVMAAERHAQLLGENVRPEHLLLGILERTDSIAVRTLVGAGVDVDAVRRELSPPGRPESRRSSTASRQPTFERATSIPSDIGRGDATR